MANSNPQQLSWTADATYLLTGITFANIVAVLSKEPSLTFAQYAQARDVVEEEERFFLFNPSGSNPGQLLGMTIEMPRGSVIFVANGGQASLGLVQLLLEEKIESADI